MTRDPLAAGDLIAERRFAYAKAAAEAGDWSTAAELFEQALERAPHWAAAWFALGRSPGEAGRLSTPRLKPFVKRWSPIPPMRRARWRGSRSSAEETRRPGCRRPMSRGYSTDYAPRFDKHLTKNLGYRAPALIAEALSVVALGPRRFASALDLGCGTGLMGAALRGRADRLTGVDLSPAMIAKARERGVYDELIVGDAVALLESRAAGVS